MPRRTLLQVHSMLFIDSGHTCTNNGAASAGLHGEPIRGVMTGNVILPPAVLNSPPSTARLVACQQTYYFWRAVLKGGNRSLGWVITWRGICVAHIVHFSWERYWIAVSGKVKHMRETRRSHYCDATWLFALSYLRRSACAFVLFTMI